MSVLFVGHGSPMNAIEHNAFTEALTGLSARLLKPKAVCVVSAHWSGAVFQAKGRACPERSRRDLTAELRRDRDDGFRKS
jgi:4,5-DOPA dioxygenase extradiol